AEDRPDVQSSTARGRQVLRYSRPVRGCQRHTSTIAEMGPHAMANMVPTRPTGAILLRDQGNRLGIMSEHVPDKVDRAGPRGLRATAAGTDPDDPVRGRGPEHVRDPDGPQPRPATAGPLAVAGRPRARAGASGGLRPWHRWLAVRPFWHPPPGLIRGAPLRARPRPP